MANEVNLYSHGDPQVILVQEAAGAADRWLKRELVKFDGSGAIDDVASAGVIAGIARAAATGTTGTLFELELLDPNAIYVIRADASTTPLQTGVGEAWSLSFTTTAQSLASTAGSNKEVYIVGLHPGDTAANGSRVLVRFSTTKTFDDLAA